MCLVIPRQHLPSLSCCLGCHYLSASPTCECVNLYPHRKFHSSVALSLYRSSANFHSMVLIRSVWRWLNACLISNPPSKYDTCECSIKPMRFAIIKPSHGSFVASQHGTPLPTGRKTGSSSIGKYCSISAVITRTCTKLNVSCVVSLGSLLSLHPSQDRLAKVN